MSDIPLDELIYHVDMLKEASRRIKEWQEVYDQSRAAIEAALGEEETGTIAGQAVVRWSSVTSNRVSQSLLKGNFPDVYRAVILPQTSRRFTLVEPT